MSSLRFLTPVIMILVVGCQQAPDSADALMPRVISIIEAIERRLTEQEVSSREIQDFSAQLLLALESEKALRSDQVKDVRGQLSALALTQARQADSLSRLKSVVAELRKCLSEEKQRRKAILERLNREWREADTDN